MTSSHPDIPAPYPAFRGTVLPTWIDINGHMNIAYYVLAFDLGTDALFDFMGLDKQYREQENCSTFTVELHVNYVREILEGDRFEVKSQVLGVDKKRLHVFHTMHHEASGDLAATNEIMFVHIDMETRRSSPFPDTMQTWIQQIVDTHASLPRPDNAGRGIGFERPT